MTPDVKFDLEQAAKDLVIEMDKAFYPFNMEQKERFEKIKEFGQRCADEAYERAAMKIMYFHQHHTCDAKNNEPKEIRSLKSTAGGTK